MTDTLRIMYGEHDLTEDFLKYLGGLFQDLENACVEAASEQLEEMVFEEYRNWLQESRAVIINSLRVEKTEALEADVIDLFLKNYAFVPDRKIDVAAALVAENKQLSIAVASANETARAISEQQEAIERAQVLAEIHQETGCTLMTKGKLSQLCEGLHFNSRDTFKSAALQLFETHFSKKPVKPADLLAEEYFGEGDGRSKRPNYQTQLVADSVRALG